MGFGQFILLNYKKSAKYILAAQSKINENDFDLDQHPKQNDAKIWQILNVSHDMAKNE